MKRKQEKEKFTVNMPLQFSVEANIYDHSQHFLYARLQKKYARPTEFTDRYHNPDATFGPIRERQ